MRRDKSVDTHSDCLSKFWYKYQRGPLLLLLPRSTREYPAIPFAHRIIVASPPPPSLPPHQSSQSPLFLCLVPYYIAKMMNKLVLLLAAAAGALAERACGTPEPTEAQIAQAKIFQAQEQEARLAGNTTRMAAAADITVNTYFHVVASSRTTAGGYLSVCEPLYTNLLHAREHPFLFFFFY